MTGTFTNYAIELMGFKDTVNRGDISASFMSLIVFEIRGVSLPEDYVHAELSVVANASYRIAIAGNINIAYQHAVGVDFAKYDSELRESFNVLDAIAVIAVGPTDFIDCDAGKINRSKDGTINTYRCFPEIRSLIKSLEDRVLPPVTASITLALTDANTHVSLREIHRDLIGRTADGITIIDFNPTVSFSISTKRKLSPDFTTKVIKDVLVRTTKINKTAASYFSLGAGEKDQLKKFLFFFLSIEIETQAKFSSIKDKKEHHEKIIHSPVLPSAFFLISRDISKWNNLYDKFVWCANFVWPQITEKEIDAFKEMKEVRDGIAHGRYSMPPPDFASKAELLAHKILWN